MDSSFSDNVFPLALSSCTVNPSDSFALLCELFLPWEIKEFFKTLKKLYKTYNCPRDSPVILLLVFQLIFWQLCPLPALPKNIIKKLIIEFFQINRHISWCKKIIKIIPCTLMQYYFGWEAENKGSLCPIFLKSLFLCVAFIFWLKLTSCEKSWFYHERPWKVAYESFYSFWKMYIGFQNIELKSLANYGKLWHYLVDPNYVIVITKC